MRRRLFRHCRRLLRFRLLCLLRPILLRLHLSKGEEVMQRIAEAPARLETKGYEVLEDEFIAVAKPEDLRQEDRDIYEAVRGTGLGLCGRCRWRSGCQSCDEVKAWAFACRSTLWHTAHEAVRPKAKPRGRPKRAAAKA